MDLHPVLQGLCGTLFTWGMTAAGAGVVFFAKQVNKKILDCFYGFAAGVMISASCFGLLLPSITIAEEQAWSKNIAWLPTSIGFLLGVAFLKCVGLFFLGSHSHEHHPSSVELRDVEIKSDTNGNGNVQKNKESKTKPLNLQRSTSYDSIHLIDDADLKKSPYLNGVPLLPFEYQSQTATSNPSSHSSYSSSEFVQEPSYHHATYSSEDEDDPKEKEKSKFCFKLNKLCWGDHDTTTHSWRRTLMLIAAITLHNFPEGLAVGVAFGAIQNAPDRAHAFHNAVGLAFGIGIQNFPEGLGISMPLRREGMSRTRAFFHGQLSGVVEPIGGVLGAAAVLVIQPLLPFALSFAAGAMIFVVVEELIPESQGSGNRNVATLGTVLGFTIMMCLDIALG